MLRRNSEESTDVSRELAEAKDLIDASDITEICDPITFEILKYPVLGTDDRLYELESIQQHLLHDPTSPFTRQPLGLIPLPDPIFKKLQEIIKETEEKTILWKGTYLRTLKEMLEYKKKVENVKKRLNNITNNIVRGEQVTAKIAEEVKQKDAVIKRYQKKLAEREQEIKKLRAELQAMQNKGADLQTQAQKPHLEHKPDVVIDIQPLPSAQELGLQQSFYNSRFLKAVAAGNLQLAYHYLKEGADPAAKNAHGETALDLIQTLNNPFVAYELKELLKNPHKKPSLLGEFSFLKTPERKDDEPLPPTMSLLDVRRGLMRGKQ